MADASTAMNQAQMKRPSNFGVVIANASDKEVFVNTYCAHKPSVRIRTASVLLVERKYSMSLTSDDAKEVYTADNQSKPGVRLFYCNAHDEMNHSFAVYVRANTHDEAVKRMVEYWLTDGSIDNLDDIDEESIEVFEVPSAEGRPGVVEWDAIDFKSVPKDGLL
jgi:hypothetical protein